MEQVELSPDTVLRLARFFGTSAEFWMSLQYRWALETAADVLRDDLARIEPMKQASLRRRTSTNSPLSRFSPAHLLGALDMRNFLDVGLGETTEHSAFTQLKEKASAGALALSGADVTAC